MNKLIAVAFGAAIGLAVTTSANAMPLAPLDQAQPEMTIQVAGGCGPGFHRGPRGGCRRNAGAVVVVPGAAVVVPGVRACPRGFHLGPAGRCRPNRY